MDVNPAATESLKAYESAPVASVRRPEHAESSVTRLMEQQTAKIPSHYFLLAAVVSMGASVAFELTGNQRMSRFTGMWAPTLMIAGVYNKLVKEFGVH